MGRRFLLGATASTAEESEADQLEEEELLYFGGAPERFAAAFLLRTSALLAAALRAISCRCSGVMVFRRALPPFFPSFRRYSLSIAASLFAITDEPNGSVQESQLRTLTAKRLCSRISRYRS